MNDVATKEEARGGSLPPLVLRLKEVCGVPCASCRSCDHLGEDNDGSEYSSNSWPVCTKHESMSNLRSFPFKKEMACWEPGFWLTKFADLKTGTDEEFNAAVLAYNEACTAVCQAAENVLAHPIPTSGGEAGNGGEA